MAMNQENSPSEIKEHVKDTSVWVRLLYMALFAVLNWVAKVVLVVVVIFQFLMVLFTGKKNDKVLELGAQLSTYIYQIYRFLTFNSEEHPFPLNDWPSAAELKEASASKAKATETVSTTADTKKPVRKRAPAKKKAPADKAETEAPEQEKPASAE